MFLEISKSFPSYSFHSISSKLYEDIGSYVGMQAVIFLAICQILKKIVTLEILTWESMGKF